MSKFVLFMTKALCLSFIVSTICYGAIVSAGMSYPSIWMIACGLAFGIAYGIDQAQKDLGP